MAATTLRDAHAHDGAAILALNLAEEEMLSPMDATRLHHLASQAACLRVACDGEAVVAFLLAFREGADYDSPNYLWFAQRYRRFLYVDRVAVAASHRGQGLGRRLYEELFDLARRQGVEAIACEYYTVPPNEASRRFHAGFGFREVGSQWLPERRKQVSLQIATI